MSARKESIKAAMTAARERTLWLLSQVPDDFLKRRVHSFYSPIGWHFGHIARTEEYWIANQALGRPFLDEAYSFLFADLPENPKDNRVNLPSRGEIVGYLGSVRARVFELLDEVDLSATNPFLADGYAWEFAFQHECQHQETICEMMQLIVKASSDTPLTVEPLGVGLVRTEMADIPKGSFLMGSDDLHGYDNEKRAHEVHVEAFKMARTQVTAGQWMEFLADGGYQRPELWTADGWAWREAEQSEMPEYWVRLGPSFGYFGPRGIRSIHPDEPASCLSWFEADAFARWAGKRLPTEAEWEYAAQGGNAQKACAGMANWSPRPVGSCPEDVSSFGLHDMSGNVWEWTSTPFLPYPGFEAFPYDGYSKDHMKGQHKVCRGGIVGHVRAHPPVLFPQLVRPNLQAGLLGSPARAIR